jgi:pilus assembly protein CpaB
LEVTPQEAEKLDLARSVGTLSLVLRNPADAAPAQTQGARKQDLLALAPQGPPDGTAAAPSAHPPKARATPTAKPSAPIPPNPTTLHNAEAADGRAEVIRGTQRTPIAW